MPIDHNHKSEVAKRYNRFERNKPHEKFYHSPRWLNARKEFVRQHPLCERCGDVVELVHHLVPLGTCSVEDETHPRNLQSLCIACHNIAESEIVPEEPATSIGTLDLKENDFWMYDAVAAEQPIRFVEKFFQHYEGRFAGQPFKLLEWQKRDIIRPLFGWKSRDTGLRRFNEVYLISGKGAGKTPLMATAIGLFMFLADGEAAPHVVSMGSSFEQAGLTFNAAKLYLEESPLAKHPQIDWKQFSITGPNHARWTVVSGKNKGRSGTRPSCVLADEVHEYERESVNNHMTVTANMFKRSQPILFNATNAGPDRQCFAWKLHERATHCLDGHDDPHLLPVIFEAPADLDWRSEQAARAANPSIPEIVTFDQIKAKQITLGEPEYRRRHLSQWITGSDKFVNQESWRAIIGKCSPPDDAPLYLGLDLAKVDDLCAAVEVYPTRDLFHCRSHFWLPRATAKRYEEKDFIPYSEWEKAGDIKLIDDATISPKVQSDIAKEIIALHEQRKITAVCYDRAYSSGVIPALEQAGIPCVAIGQGWELSPGCAELDRRLIERSIVIESNGVMDFCSSNVEVTRDKHDNCWPIKPGQTSGNSTGRRAAKVDGIVALCNALVKARTHIFPKAASHVGALTMEW